MISRKNPCFGCEKRSATCRCECPAWLEYVKKRDAEYASSEKRAEIDYVGHVIDRMERCRKRIRKKNKRMK